MSWRLLKNAVSLTHGSLCIIAMMKHGMSLLARLLLQSSVLRILSQGWKDVSDVRKIPERPKSRHNRSSNINSFFDADSLGSLFALGVCTNISKGAKANEFALHIQRLASPWTRE